MSQANKFANPLLEMLSHEFVCDKSAAVKKETTELVSALKRENIDRPVIYVGLS